MLLIVTSVLFPLLLTLEAEIPRMLGFQGKVTDSGGGMVPDGPYDIQFRIYNLETAGTALWNSETLSVDVTGGIFSVLLGDGNPINLDFDEDYWIEVEIEGDVQSPRQPLGSAGYAYMASGLVPGTVVEGDVASSVLEVTNTRTGSGYGVRGNSYGSSGRGIYGRANATTGTTYGVYGHANSSSGRGVYGEANATTGITYGVYGSSSSVDTEAAGVYGSGDNRGVYGKATNTAGTAHGGYFESSSSSGGGVYGYAPHIGVQGVATDATGLHYGGYFESNANQASAIRAFATSPTGSYATYGVYGRSYASGDGSIGVYGRSSYNSNSGATYGVYGRSDGQEPSPSGPYPLGVYGLAGNTSSSFGIGGYFQSNAYQGCGAEGQGRLVGVRAVATATSGLNFGVAATTSSAAGVAGWFEGDVNVTGDIHKSNCYFLIDHPLDPENKLLRHTCVESPEGLLIYRGEATLDTDGETVVELPSYFEVLTDEAEASVHLTPHGKPFLAGFEWEPGHTAFTVYGSPERTVSWMVLAGRDDPVARQHQRPVEEEKGSVGSLCNRGELLYPAAYGYPKTTGMAHKIFSQNKTHLVVDPAD
jgi:hypothetical protein